MTPTHVARRIVDAVNSRQLDALDQHWSPALVEEVPLAGRLEGRDAARIDLRGIDCMTVRDGVLVSNLVAYDAMAFAAQADLLATRHG